MRELNPIEVKGSVKFLRWQVLVPEFRRERYPVYMINDIKDISYDKSPIIDWTESERVYKFQKLVGFGSTREKALDMAMGKA